ncbi:unnamed protein product [Pedinophyceae sp. YPF-701]|nr:unnamed protein product [Pedinophyceae sp. YPF-701]
MAALHGGALTARPPPGTHCPHVSIRTQGPVQFTCVRRRALVANASSRSRTPATPLESRSAGREEQRIGGEGSSAPPGTNGAPRDEERPVGEPPQLPGEDKSWPDRLSSLVPPALIYGAVAWDVNAAGSPHLLAPLDSAVHNFVSSSVGSELQQILGRAVLSEAAIYLSLAGIIGGCSLQLFRCPRAALPRIGLLAGFYFFGGGAVLHSDPFLVDALKETFERARPNGLGHTFSFPSGHTTAAVFMTGAFLVYVLPWLAYTGTLASRTLPRVDASDPQLDPYDIAVQLDEGGSTPPEDARDVDEDEVLFGRPPAWVPAVWAVAGGTTALGRVLADVHWVSDTIAGAALGYALALTLRQSDQWCNNAVELIMQERFPRRRTTPR